MSLSTKDLDLPNLPLKILLVGENGLGKSIAGAGFHKAGPLWIADCDARLKPVKAYYPDADIKYDSYTALNFNKFSDWMEGILDGKGFSYKTMMLDSMTSFSITSVVYQLAVKDIHKRTASGKGLPTTSWDEINGETVMFHDAIEVCKILYDKGCHIIWTAHPIPKTIIEEDKTKRIVSLAAFGNKVPAFVPCFFDEIYNFAMEKKDLQTWERVFYTVPHNNMPGKTVFPNLLPERIDITNKNFYEVLMGYLKGEVKK